MAGYRARLADLGFQPIFDCATAGCGGFDFRFGVQLLPAPMMLIDTADFAQFSASRTDEEACAFDLASQKKHEQESVAKMRERDKQSR